MGIILILLLGFVLRLVYINQSFWLDESVQALTSLSPFLNLFSELKGDFHPPLYHFLMWGWAHLFGNSEFVMRLPSVVFGTATIYVVYLIAKQLVNKKSKLINFLPLVAALFLATAPFHIYYSQEARTYALTAFSTSLSIYWFLRLMNSRLSEGKITWAYILSTVFMLYSDYYGLFVFFFQIIAGVLILRKRTMELIRNFIITFVFFLPALFLLAIQLKTGIGANAILPGWGELVNLSFFKALPLTFVKFSIGRITIFNKKIYALVAIILFGLYSLLMVNGFLKKKKKIMGKNNSILLILFWFLIPVFLAWIVSFLIPNYQPFRLLLVLPAFYLLLAIGISSIIKPFLRNIALVLVLLVNLISLGVYYKNPYFHREDWRGLVNYIEETAQKKEYVLLPSHTSHWPYKYYSQDKVGLISVAEGIRTVNEKDFEKISLEDIDGFYYIYYLADLFDPQDLVINWLDEGNFVKIEEVSFNQLKLEIWQKENI